MLNSFLIDIFIECTVCVHTAERKGGTGFFVSPGYVLTCAHVVLDAWKNQISISIYWRNEKIGDAKVIQCCNIDYPDLALLQIDYTEHPCVYLDQEISLNDGLYSYGYPKDHRDGDSVTFLYEGPTSLQKPLLKLKAGQAIPGMSGAPLLNLRTGKVCGIIRSTRNEYSDLGGRAISTETILVNLPELVTLHDQFHYQDKRWLNNLSILPEPILNRMGLSRILASEVAFLQTDRHPFRASSRSDFYSYISLPINYIERKNILSDMREKLTNVGVSIGRTPYAIHGMGGLGKTVLARALCEDPIIQATFPDGILWATLGQRSKNEFIPTMRSWVELLGGSIHENAPTIESLKNLLAGLLKNRSCLLILDDVWRYSDAELFRVGGEYCGLLLTLRDAEIAYELGAKIQAVPFMTNTEAIALLEAWANNFLVKTPLCIKEQIVARLGYLPLAIKLAGAQLRRSEPDKWLHTFDIRKLKSSRPENLHDDLELTFRISMESLDEQDLTLYIALAIFKKSRPILVAGIMHLWRSLGNLGAGEIENILKDLASRALIEIPQYDSADFVIIHDLIYDIISRELGDKSENTHQMLINEYSSGQKDVDWSTIHNDGYLYDNLAFHLYAAKSGEELKKLFINPRWLHARVKQCLYTYDGYLEDLSLAWKWAIAETQEQIDNNNQSPQSFVDCMRYLLLESSIHSIVDNYGAKLVAQAVREDFWTVDRALSIISKMTYPYMRALAYVQLLATEKLSEKQYKEVTQASIRIVSSLIDIGKIKNRLPVQYLTHGRGQMLVALAPYLKEELIHEGLEIALVLEDCLERVQALIALFPSLEIELRSQILERELNAALILENHLERIEVLVALSPYLVSEQRKHIIETELTVILALDEKRQCSQCLAALAPQLEGELLIRALEAVFVLDDFLLARTLTAFAPYLEGNLVDQTLQVALSINGMVIERMEILSALSLHLPKERCIQILERELTVALAVKDESVQVLYLTAMASALPDELLERCVEATLSLTDTRDRAAVIDKLAPRLRNGLLKTVLEAIYIQKDGWRYVNTIVDIMYIIDTKRNSHLLQYQLHKANKISNKRISVSFLAKMSSVLEPDLVRDIFQRELQNALLLEDPHLLVVVVSSFALYLTKEHFEQVPDLLDQAFDAVLKVPSQWDIVNVVRVLVPHLTKKHFEQLQEIIPTIEDSFSYVQMLVSLAPYLNEDLLRRGLNIVSTWDVNIYRGNAVAKLAPYLPLNERLNILSREVNAIQEKKDYKHYNEIYSRLAELVPLIPNERLEVCLKVVIGIEESKIAEMIIALAYRLEGKLLEQGLEMVLALEEEEYFGKSLIALAPQLKGNLFEKALNAALALKNEKIRVEVLASFLSIIPNQQSLIKATQIALLNYAWSARHWPCEQVLRDFFNKSLLRPSIFSVNLIEKILLLLMEIYEQWTWL